jgi:prepilin-type N-terminal cleavage/methylation domain-containing protein
MNMYHSPTTTTRRRHDDEGFTLIEILIAIVLIGILSAVAVVGISNLVSKGGTSACGATKDAATAASAVYFTSQTINTYPPTLLALSTSGAFTLPSGVTVNTVATSLTVAPIAPVAAAIGMQTSGASWFLTMTSPGTATTPPVFACN